MNRWIAWSQATLLFAGLLFTSSLGRAQNAETSEAFRLDYRLVRSEDGEKQERRYSMLVAAGRTWGIDENANRLVDESQWIGVGMSLNVEARPVERDRLWLSTRVRIQEADPSATDARAGRVDVSANGQSVVPLGKRTSLASLETQDGRRRYELFVTAVRATE